MSDKNSRHQKYHQHHLESPTVGAFGPLEFNVDLSQDDLEDDPPYDAQRVPVHLTHVEHCLPFCAPHVRCDWFLPSFQSLMD